MFSYYGSKSKIVHLYPKPKHSLIIEPFAGSARYALRYFDRDVILIDKYKTIIDVWKYLQQASEKDILSLPKLRVYADISTLNLSDVEKQFLGFIYAQGLPSPRMKVSSFGDFENGNQRLLENIAKSLYKIRHWQIIEGDFTDAPEVEATWFIDPPYFKGGEHYIHNTKDLNFNFLRDWTTSRKGQVIVCENTGADWLPFIKLRKIQGSASTFTTEVFWTNEKVEVQANLFPETSAIQKNGL